MAKFVSAPLGKFRGALGDALFRKINGKFLVGVKPDSFTAGTDDKAVKRRQRFSMAAKFATAVNLNPSLKIIWDVNTPDTMSPYNGALKANYHRCVYNDVSDDATLCPVFNAFNIVPTAKTLTNSSISLTVEALGTGNLIDPNVEKLIQMAVVVFCKSPINAELHPDYYFYSFVSTKIALNLNSPLTFDAVLSQSFANEFDWFSEHKAFMALCTFDLFGKVINYSYTVNTSS